MRSQQTGLTGPGMACLRTMTSSRCAPARAKTAARLMWVRVWPNNGCNCAPPTPIRSTFATVRSRIRPTKAPAPAQPDSYGLQADRGRPGYRRKINASELFALVRNGVLFTWASSQNAQRNRLSPRQPNRLNPPDRGVSNGPISKYVHQHQLLSRGCGHG